MNDLVIFKKFFCTLEIARNYYTSNISFFFIRLALIFSDKKET